VPQLQLSPSASFGRLQRPMSALSPLAAMSQAVSAAHSALAAAGHSMPRAKIYGRPSLQLARGGGGCGGFGARGSLDALSPAAAALGSPRVTPPRCSSLAQQVAHRVSSGNSGRLSNPSRLAAPPCATMPTTAARNGHRSSAGACNFGGGGGVGGVGGSALGGIGLVGAAVGGGLGATLLRALWSQGSTASRVSEEGGEF
jgi:hypothetical protein